MSSCQSVSEWIDELHAGESFAAQKLWERYVSSLVRLAKRNLGNSPRMVADEEDVANEAFASFCRAVAAGRFPQLDDRDDLWQILAMLTERKAVDQIRRELADKRGAGRVLGESAIAGKESEITPADGAAQIVDNAPSPEFAMLLAEEFECVMSGLNDDLERKIAVAKMEGYRNKEIGQELDISLRTVERKLSLIRRVINRKLHEESE